jgi:hypothetical protein
MTLDLKKDIKKRIDDKLERLRKDRHDYSAALLTEWLVERAKKKPVPDLAKRTEQFTKDIYKMCEDMRLEIKDGAFVVKVNGAAEQTYKKLRLGTDWFEPNADVVTQIMAGLDVRFGS